MKTYLRWFAVLPLLLISGCDLLGIETLSQVQARQAQEGQAIGSACRHAGRAIEDCYALNKRADKAAIFAGWREMNDYMTENQIETVRPSIGEPTAKATDDAEEEDAPPKGKAGHDG
jgi:hypothetical protein